MTKNNIFNYKEECKDCSMLIEVGENQENYWYCDEAGCKCSDIEYCSFENCESESEDEDKDKNKK